ncbi:MAG: PadR family transcriptional regulator [Thermomicrobiales bacterium]|nr:MAG: PadR family transcriptional regulator [Thermomicrobiales bacterium]
MPRPAQPAEHAILGLLYFEQDGGHGYDLARHFGDEQPLGDVLKLEPGMLYHHLKKLARTGWVTVDIEPQGTRPPRQVYTLTEEGKDELLRWLREPVQHTREIRLEFLIKLYFARLLDPVLAADLIRGQLAKSREMEAMLEARLGDATSPTDDFGRQVLDLRLLQTRAAIAWLESL